MSGETSRNPFFTRSTIEIWFHGKLHSSIVIRWDRATFLQTNLYTIYITRDEAIMAWYSARNNGATFLRKVN